MINWNLLGIEPTKDISSIKKAYKTKLAETNPEDKPEEFMALREAFEAAMEWAADEDADEEGQTEDLLPEDHPAYGWLQELKSLYANFAKRIDPNSWKALISDPLCTRIDTAADVERTLLVFLMDYWYVPDSVIRTLNEVFRFDENKDRLMEQYPEAFVDAILLTPLQRTLPFEYDLFQVEDGKDYDQFIRLYYNLTGMINQGEFEEASHCLKEIEETGIFHPYINIEKAKLHLSTEQLPAAIKDMEEVSETYRNSPSICCMAGEVELAREDFAKAKEYFLRANQLAPDYKWAKLGLGESTLGQQNYKEAEEWIFQVLSEDRYSPRGKALESQIANAQKEQLIEKMGAENATPEEMLKLAGLHIDNGQSDQAKEVLLHYHSEDLMEESERLHYLGTAELELDNYSASFSYFQQAEALLRQLRSVNADQENIGRIDANTCRTMIMSSLPLEHQGKSKEALEIVTNATIDFPDQPMAFCRKAELHYELKMYQEAIDAATQSIQLDDSFHLPYRIRANAYYELGYYNNAYDDCNDCIALYGGDLQVFLCKINILIEVNEIEGAFAELDDLEAQVQGSELTFLRGKAYEASGELEKAKSQYLEVLKMVRDESREVFYPAEVPDLSGTYYRLYQVCRGLYDENYDEALWKEALEYLKIGLNLFPDDLNFLSELAGEYFADSEYIKAQDFYERMVELDPSARHYAQRAGNELRIDMFDEAKRDLDLAAERNPNLTYIEILRGTLCMHLENYADGLIHYQNALALSEKNEETWYRIYRDMADIYCRMQNYEMALDCLRKNAELYHQEEDTRSILEILRMQGEYQQAYTTGDAFIEENGAENSQQILNELVSCAQAQGDREKFDFYNRMLRNQFSANYNLGRYLIYQGDHEESLNAFLAAADYGRRNINNNIEIAKLFLRLKNKKEAKKYAAMVCDEIPADYMRIGYDRAYHLVRSAEAFIILGNYTEAKRRLEQALTSRKCDFCKYSGCIDAYCALVYLYCILGDEALVEKYVKEGKEVSQFDYDILHLPDRFLKKRGLFK